MVVPGYWDDPAATAENFIAGYWHSGDIGSIDADGYVRVFDRKKDMINRGGYKIYSVEVENALMASPGVVEAAVVGEPCPVLGERVHAVRRRAPASQPTTRRCARHCAELLADYKVPETLHAARPSRCRATPTASCMKRNLRDEIIGSTMRPDQ